jgi:hypothetical protein
LHHAARILAPLLWILWPAPGRRRSPGVHPAEREESWRQRSRRCVLWLALCGIDVSPRRIHDVEVTA